MGAYNNEAHARETAEKVRDMMDNPDFWEIDVWENLGWHCAIKCNNVSMIIRLHNGHLSYSALISGNADSCGGGLAAWTKESREEHPQDEVNAAIAAAEIYVWGLEYALDTAKEAGGLGV